MNNNSIIGVLTVLISASCNSVPQEETKQPNFIVVIADDAAWDDCGPYGNHIIKTPNINKLAEEGVIFNNAFLTTSSCSPSRCCILTGRYPHSTGAPELHMPLPAEQLLFAGELQKAGYYTAVAGKYHIGPQRAEFDTIYGGSPSGCEYWVYQGVDDNTLIIYMSDNGRPFPRAKTRMYDSGIKTPFIVRWPAKLKKGTTDALVSSIDIAPTFCELAGAGISDTYQGVSFVPILENSSANIREYIAAEHNWHDYQAHERAIRNKQYLYIRNAFPELNASPPADAVRSITYQEMIKLYHAGELNDYQLDCLIKPRPAEELYDVVNDPYQLHNLAENPEFSKALIEMQRLLDNWVPCFGS